MTVVTEVVILTSFSKNTLTLWQPTTLRAAIRNSCDVFDKFTLCLISFFAFDKSLTKDAIFKLSVSGSGSPSGLPLVSPSSVNKYVELLRSTSR